MVESGSQQGLSPQQRAILALTLTSGLGPTLIRRAIKTLGSAEAVTNASIDMLKAVDGIASQRAEAIRKSLDEITSGSRVDEEIEIASNHGARIITIDDDEYPPLLKHIPDPPPLLYVRGNILKQDNLGLAVVGSRRCSHYGRDQAQRMSASAATAGMTIVSGGARGIDGVCHQAAMRIGGRTIAVLGSGLAKPYPPEHAELFVKIAEEFDGRTAGAVISEFPMMTDPMGENFPKRNRIISGMSLGVLVIEAAVRSGALITARLASEEHNREVMAVPGRVDSAASAGCHKIIREGWATLVTNGAEILECLGEAGRQLQSVVDASQAATEPDLPFDKQGDTTEPAATSNAASINLSPTQKQLIRGLQEPLHLDELPRLTGLAVHQIQADLTILEIRGLVKREGNRFVSKS